MHMPIPIGIATNRGDAAERLDLIKQADQLRIPTVWLTQAGLGPDTLSLFAGAATQTEHVALGTAIIPIWPHHPLAVAQQALAVASLAPGRLRLGLGTGGPGITQIYGYPYDHPLGHLREYIAILKTLFATGQVNFDGQYYKAHGRLGTRDHPIAKLDVPVLASALRRRSYELCGETTDGALSWVCPIDYLKQVALPALREGAKKAGRPTPPLIAHVPVALDENVSQVRAAVRTELAIYPRLSPYQEMFKAAGFPETTEGQWSDRMIDAIVVHGDAAAIKQRLAEIQSSGVQEIMVHPIATGSDRPASMRRILELVAAQSR
jgi:F420-dependent oxidoreductase-like protein